MKYPRIGLLTATLIFCSSVMADGKVLEKALADEMARTLSELRLEDADPPYFVSYTVHHDHQFSVAGSFGGLVSKVEDKSRTLNTQLRIGDYELDNTNFGSQNIRRVGTSTRLPIENDYHAIRESVWLLTDRVYRNAVDLLAGKRAAMENFTIVEQLPDFNQEEPVIYHETPSYTLPPMEDVVDVVSELSAISNKQDHIIDSSVQAFVSNHHDYYVNSEGTTFTRIDDYARIVAVSKARAEDGQAIADFVAYQARTWDELPSASEIANDIKEVNSKLKERQTASTIESTPGPVLIRGQAAAELLVQVLGVRLVATRPPIADSARLNQNFSSRLRNPWQDTIGTRVLPRNISVYSDPTLTEYQGGSTFGTLTIDDEGVVPVRVELIRRGLLKTLLTTRVPTSVSQKSTGNRRSMGRFGNIIVESRGGLPEEELMEEFRLLIEEREKDYGLVITRLMSPVNSNELIGSRLFVGAPIPVIAAKKVYLDGTEEPVRNVFISQFHVSKFKDIIATSDTSELHHVSTTFAGINGDFDSDIAGSVITPDFLIEDVTVVPTQGAIPTLPILDHPVAKN